MATRKKAPPSPPGRAAPPAPAPKKKRGAFPKAGSSKAPPLKSLASLIVESETVELGGRWSSSPVWGHSYILSLEFIDCGKCPRAHGPYWYAMKREKSDYADRGKLRRVYVGKKKDKAKAEALLRFYDKIEL